MFFLNLSLPEFLALLGTVSGVAVALYLLDRARRKQNVATLRFFAGAAGSPQRAHRRHVQQPISLLVQLLSMALLLLALAQVRCGNPERTARLHVLILDTSAWMNSRLANARLIDQARAKAHAYLRSIPSNDRVMLVRADALATPATGFTKDRRELNQAIDTSQPGASVLNAVQAVRFAAEAQRIQQAEGVPGEIAFVGAERVDRESVSSADLPSNLRVIPVAGGGAIENCGLRRVTVRRSEEQADRWDIFASVKNYSAAAKNVSVVVVFAGTPSGSQQLTLKPGGETDVSFHLTAAAAGFLDVRLTPTDVFAQDNRAVLELPALVRLPVAVYTDSPETLRPLLKAIPGVQASFESPASYNGKTQARIVVLDRFAPPEKPSVDTVWIEPPAGQSPIPVAPHSGPVKLSHWRSDYPVAAGLHTIDMELDHALVFRPVPEDVSVAESSAGPLIVAREGKNKIVALGFHPMRSALKYQLATPLLFANIIRWMAPDIFRSVELSSEAPGTVTAELSSNASTASLQVTDQNGNSLPFTRKDKEVRFFSGAPGVARVIAGNQELIFALTLPAAGDLWWNPSGVRKGIPPESSVPTAAYDLWPWLAFLGGLGLFIDWLLFGGPRRRKAALRPQEPAKLRKAS